MYVLGKLTWGVILGFFELRRLKFIPKPNPVQCGKKSNPLENYTGKCLYKSIIQVYYLDSVSIFKTVGTSAAKNLVS